MPFRGRLWRASRVSAVAELPAPALPDRLTVRFVGLADHTRNGALAGPRGAVPPPLGCDCSWSTGPACRLLSELRLRTGGRGLRLAQPIAFGQV